MLEGDKIEEEFEDNGGVETIDDVDIITKKHDLADWLRSYYGMYEVAADFSTIERLSYTNNEISCNYFIYMTGMANPFAYIKAGPEVVIHKKFKDTNLAKNLIEAILRFNASDDKDYYIGTIFYI